MKKTEEDINRNRSDADDTVLVADTERKLPNLLQKVGRRARRRD